MNAYNPMNAMDSISSSRPSANLTKIFAAHFDAIMSSDTRQAKYAGGYGALSSKCLAQAIRSSRASTEREMNKTSLPSFYEALPVRNSILSRPLHGNSQMTRENLDAQFQADSMKWQRKRETFSKAAESPAHHHGPSVLTLWEQGHIATKGKGKGIPQNSFDPSLLQGGSADRPSSAPHQRPSPSLGSSHHQKCNPFNPILQQGEPEPSTRRPLSAVPRPPTFNPILGKITHPSSSSFEHPPAPPQHPPQHPPTPGRRPKVESGISWGTYNPLTHEYKSGLQPADPRYVDQEALAVRARGISGKQKGRVQQGTNRDQGVYNPITNVWIVQPSNPRVIQGLHFSTPTKAFSNFL